jgi:hypothetical protein
MSSGSVIPAAARIALIHASALLAGCEAVLLAQFSMAAAAPVVQRERGCIVLSSPDCAVLALQRRMAPHA